MKTFFTALKLSTKLKSLKDAVLIDENVLKELLNLVSPTWVSKWPKEH